MTKAADYPVPTTDEQEIALEKALAEARKRRFESVRDFLDSDVCKAFTEGLQALGETRLPEGSSSKNNVGMMVANLATMRQTVDQELSLVENVINPAPPPAPVPMLPPVPLQ
jgi:vacuolar-type H+-ATPase subunit E/Vma4